MFVGGGGVGVLSYVCAYQVSHTAIHLLTHTCSLPHVHIHTLPPPTSDAALADVAHTAARLCVWATAQGWPATLSMLLPGTRMLPNATAADAVALLDQACPPGLTAQHVAVGAATNAARMVEIVAGWRRAQGVCAGATVAGGAGVTPLHVAALVGDVGVVEGLLEHDVRAAEAWVEVVAEGGGTPADLAEVMMGFGVVVVVVVVSVVVVNGSGCMCWWGYWVSKYQRRLYHTHDVHAASHTH